MVEFLAKIKSKIGFLKATSTFNQSLMFFGRNNKVGR